ncbi:MAG: glutaredoxin domain-containing protein [Pseudomonadota bacterium]
MDGEVREDVVSVYWQPGCTSCLRTKEFLTKHGVAFRSCNVLEHPTAMDELARFGLRQVPIVIRGERWVDGQVLRDIAELVGIRYADLGLLPVDDLRVRLDRILEANVRHLGQLPADALQEQLPNRPRSYADLVYHIANIADAFLEHEDGLPLTFDSYNRTPPEAMQTHAALAAYGRDVRARVAAWFDGPGQGADWQKAADVYYARQTLHEFLERTTWHAGQHLRQLVWVLETKGIVPQEPVGRETFDGLPMPEQVWEAV